MENKTPTQFVSGPYETKPETNQVPAQVWANGSQIANVFGPDRIARAATAKLFAASPALYNSLSYIEYAAEGIETEDDEELIQITITGRGLKDLRNALADAVKE